MVVFPDPEGPTSVKNSPSRISRFTSRTAAKSPNRLVSPFSTRNGAVLSSIDPPGSGNQGTSVAIRPHDSRSRFAAE